MVVVEEERGESETRKMVEYVYRWLCDAGLSTMAVDLKYLYIIHNEVSGEEMMKEHLDNLIVRSNEMTYFEKVLFMWILRGIVLIKHEK